MGERIPKTQLTTNRSGTWKVLKRIDLHPSETDEYLKLRLEAQAQDAILHIEIRKLVR